MKTTKITFDEYWKKECTPTNSAKTLNPEILKSLAANAWNAAVESAATHLELKNQELLLLAGELTSNELRTSQAILKNRAYKIRRLAGEAQIVENQGKSKPIDGKCIRCGGGAFFLAEDSTDYTRCNFDDGEWMQSYSDKQPSCADDSVRFFCSDCGTVHAIPFDHPF